MVQKNVDNVCQVNTALKQDLLLVYCVKLDLLQKAVETEYAKDVHLAILSPQPENLNAIYVWLVRSPHLLA